MTDSPFITPRHPLERWEDLSENEKDWIEYIRVISAGRDPKISLERIGALQQVIDGTRRKTAGRFVQRAAITYVKKVSRSQKF